MVHVSDVGGAVVKQPLWGVTVEIEPVKATFQTLISIPNPKLKSKTLHLFSNFYT